MCDFEIIQEILKNNNIGFSINNSKCDNKNSQYNVITLIAERDEKVEGYIDFFTNIYFNKENGKLVTIEILE